MSAPSMTTRMWERLYTAASFMNQQGGELWKDICEWVVEQRRTAYELQRQQMEAKAAFGQYKDEELTYAAYARCPCGAGLAYPHDASAHGFWDCADILTGRAVHKGQEGSKQHTDRLPFTFYEVKSEKQPSAGGATTRPKAAA